MKSAKRFITALRNIYYQSSHDGVFRSLSSASKVRLARCLTDHVEAFSVLEASGNRNDAIAQLIAPLIEAILPKACPLRALDQHQKVAIVLDPAMMALPMQWTYSVLLDTVSSRDARCCVCCNTVNAHVLCCATSESECSHMLRACGLGAASCAASEQSASSMTLIPQPH